MTTNRDFPRGRGLAPLLALALLSGVTSTAAADPPPAGKKPWTADDILRLRDVSEPQVSPDGRWVVFVVSEADDKENAFNTDLYLASAGTPDATPEPVRLTRSPKADRLPRWSPKGDVIAFLSGRETRPPKEGEEKEEQVWMIRPDGGEAWPAGPVDGSVTGLSWSRDGKTLALLVRERKSADRVKREKEKDDATVVDAEIRRNQVWLMDASSGAAVQVTRGAIHFQDADWSPDGTRLAIAGQPTPKVPDIFRSDIYTLHLAKALAALGDEIRRKGGPGRDAGTSTAPAQAGDPNAPTPAALAEPTVIAAARGADAGPRWSPDGALIAYVTQDGNDEWFTNAYVAVVPAAGGGPSRVLTRAFDEEADEIRFTPDGVSILFEAPQRLSSHIYRVPAGGGPVVPLTAGDHMYRAVSLSRDGRVAAFVHESAVDPPEIWSADVGPSGPFASARPLSRINAWAAEHATFPKAPFRWKGSGGMEMEGLLVKPAGAEGRRVPLLTIVHGGPAGVFNNSYSVRRGPYPLQLFAQKGFAVFMPNPRGSGAYGEAFRKANVRDWGEKDYEDIMAGVDALVASGFADPERLGIMGWSYGGFMTSRVLTKTKRFKAASVGAGVTNTFSFTGVTDIPPFMRSYFGAWPWDDPAIYTSRTALFNAKGITTPTLIQHGEADARVPISQGWELFLALKEQGVPVEFVTYPRQAHSVTEPKLLRDAMSRTVGWFSRWILGESGS